MINIFNGFWALSQSAENLSEDIFSLSNGVKLATRAKVTKTLINWELTQASCKQPLKAFIATPQEGYNSLKGWVSIKYYQRSHFHDMQTFLLLDVGGVSYK